MKPQIDEEKRKQFKTQLTETAKNARIFFGSVSGETSEWMMPTVRIKEQTVRGNEPAVNYNKFTAVQANGTILINYDSLHSDMGGLEVIAGKGNEINFIIPAIFSSLIRMKYDSAIKRFSKLQTDESRRLEFYLTIQAYGKLLAAAFIARDLNLQEAADSMEATLKHYILYDLIGVERSLPGFAKNFKIKDEMERINKAAQKGRHENITGYIFYCCDRLANKVTGSGMVEENFSLNGEPDAKVVEAVMAYHSFVNSLMALYIFLSNERVADAKIKEFIEALAVY